MRNLLVTVAALLCLSTGAMALSITHQDSNEAPGSKTDLGRPDNNANVGPSAKNAAKTTIAFQKGTTVKVNGKEVQSGYQLAPGDHVEVSGGTAELVSQTPAGARTYTLEPGAVVSISASPSRPGLVQVNGTGVVLSNGQVGHLITQVEASSLAPVPPPPNPTQNNKVVPVVSPSTP